MADDDQPVYVGNGKLRTDPFFVLKLSIPAEDVQKLQDNLENGWVSVDIKERRAPSPKGFTHYGVVNKWKPEGQESGAGSQESEKKETPKPAAAPKAEAMPSAADDVEEVSAEDLPF